MTTASIPELMVTTAADALGTMFFTPVVRRCHGSVVADTSGALLARIPFLAGAGPGGHLDIRVSMAGAQSIASSFLAIEEGPVPEHRVNDVICELANVICGSLLSTLLSERGFRLLTPEVMREPAGVSTATFEEALELESGWMTLHLNLGAV